MTRYRPPAAPKANLITPEGEKVLREELHYLWKVKRPQVTKAVSEAAAMGDRSENAEYIYGKKQLREIDRRVRYLTKRLDSLKVISQLPDDLSRVYFGAWVELEDDEGREYCYRIVGPDEFDVSKGWISIDSPMGRALLKKQVDDEVDVHSPEGSRRYYIVVIRYHE